MDNVSELIFCAFNEYNKNVYVQVNRAKYLSSLELNGQKRDTCIKDIRLEDVVVGNLEVLSDDLKSLVLFASKAPGLSQMNRSDLLNIIKHNLFPVNASKSFRLYSLATKELYYFLPNDIQYTKYWINVFMGDEIQTMIITFLTLLNNLNPTDKEISLMMIFTLALSGNLISTILFNIFFKRIEIIFLFFVTEALNMYGSNYSINLKNVMEFYKQSLFNLFALNKRDEKFMMIFAEVIFFINFD
jgi:hypothetical protein